ncbi:hypothetical protein [Pedobacter sp. HDW13]|uniref:hypothetical protein n=1 Tax=Pedobacter sp. HDW13 TaxID=2714940 RepID=UPI002106A953|nr:hypothetical protein [Pedobacter sp. HDW13]
MLFTKSFGLIMGCAFTFSAAVMAQSQPEVWLTKADRTALFTRQATGLNPVTAKNKQPTIFVNDKETFQSIDGFGYALTGGSAQHIVKMSAPARAALLKELFATNGTNIGVSYIRLSIGASDLNEKVFSYNDLPEGEPIWSRLNLIWDQIRQMLFR